MSKHTPPTLFNVPFLAITAGTSDDRLPYLPKLFVIAPEEPDGCHIVINEWNCYGYKDCKRCNCHGETCVDACPTGALYFSEMDNKVITRDNLCTGCNRCATAGCPYGSVNIFTSKRLADISKAAWSR